LKLPLQNDADGDQDTDDADDAQRSQFIGRNIIVAFVTFCYILLTRRSMKKYNK